MEVSKSRVGRCFHGGAFFDAIGDEFDDLSRRTRIINADVLDAWFPPSPRVLAALREHLPWLVQTSPPTDSSGMTRVISQVRGLEEECILPGAGSSDLIFLAFSRWLSAGSRVLLLDPTYGEYAHVCERVIGCEVIRFPLERRYDYLPDLERLVDAFHQGIDLVVLVNPNNPTGKHVPRDTMQQVIAALPENTLVWIDETYAEYAGPDQSLEQHAASHPNTIVAKSMSKAYALSGVRAGYLCASPDLLNEVRPLLPPWAVSLLAQVAAVHALRDRAYYDERYRETHDLRRCLASSLATIPSVEVCRGTANFLLCHLDATGPTSAEVVRQCRAQGVFLRDVCSMGNGVGAHALRVAVKDAAANSRIVEVLAAVLES